MSHQSLHLPSSDRKSTLYWVGTTFGVWFSTVFVLAVQGTFDVLPSDPALPTLVALAVPVTAFSAAMILVPAWRNWALELDPVLLTEFQAWRILGGLFLAVYAFGNLPGFFALPAGLGDVAVGVAAPFVVWRLRQDPAFLGSRRFRAFHYLGLVDFVVAVSAGVAARNAIPGLVDTVTTSAMGQLPLVLIPIFIVPAFIILHIIVLMQSFSVRKR